MKRVYDMARNHSRAALGGNWGRAVAIVLLTVAISILFALAETVITVVLGIPSFVDYLGTPDYYLDNLPNVALPSMLLTGGVMLLAMLVMTPLRLGETGWYYRLTYGRAEEISTVFLFFESVGQILRAIALFISLGIRKILWGVLFFCPGVLLFSLSVSLAAYGEESERLMAAVGWAMALLLCAVAGLLYGIFIQRYFLAAYLLCRDRSMGVRQAVRLSIGATKGLLADIFLFRLSFIGWYLLCLLVLPVLYVRPYVKTAMALFGRYLIEKNELSQGVADHRPEPVKR